MRRGKGIFSGAFPLASFVLMHLVLLAFISTDVAVFVGGSDINAEGSQPKLDLKVHRNYAKRNLLVNGEPVALSEHPFFLRSWPDSVRLTNDVLCGASLIHSDMIVTAAHCQGAFNYGVMAYNPFSGELDQYKTVDLQIAYPAYYRSDSINYDIMVMRLESPVVDVQPVALNYDPDFPIRRETKKDEVPGPVSLLEGLGLGITETGDVADGLEIGLFSALTNDQCFERFGRNTNAAVTEDILCADPSTDESICLGDSGGPLTARLEVVVTNDGDVIEHSAIGGRSDSDTPWTDSQTADFVVDVPVLVGIISFGNDCQSDMIPDGFARVSYFADWITVQVCKYSRVPPPECSKYRQSEAFQNFQAEQNPNGIIPSGIAKVTLEFQHDFLAEETIFVVRNAQNGSIEYVGPEYVPQRGARVRSSFWLKPGNYVLEVRDAGGDGLNNPDFVNPDYPSGSWSLSAEYSHGGVLESFVTGDSQFESLQTTVFRLPSQKEVESGPTSSPSEAPSSNYIYTPVPKVTTAASSGDSLSSTMIHYFSIGLLCWSLVLQHL